MTRKTLGIALVLLLCMGLAAADTFSFNVLNSTFNGSGAPTPAGSVTLTQSGANAVQFSINMNHFAIGAPGNTTGKDIQWMIGGGGFAMDLSSLSNLTIGSTGTAVNGNGATLTNIVLTLGSGNYDGFGSYNVNVGTTSTSNNVGNSLVSLSFTLTRTSGTLSVADFIRTTSSNCPSDPCGFVAHVNEFSTATGGNILTGFGGTNTPTVVTPEPTSLALLGSGLIGLAGSIRKKFRK